MSSMNRLRRGVIVSFLERVVNHPRQGMDPRLRIYPLRKDQAIRRNRNHSGKTQDPLSAKRIEFNNGSRCFHTSSTALWPSKVAFAAQPTVQSALGCCLVSPL